ncbi:hypothetical protein PFISCL1PPCAC_19518, partial [Pristionchus fissidentatus]
AETAAAAAAAAGGGAMGGAAAMDPMQRMAAMSHNPMAYAQQAGMRGGYPPGYPPQGYPPQAYGAPHPQMYAAQQPGQPPRPMQPGQSPAYPGGYPPQGYPPYPGYPPHPQMNPQMRYPGMPPQGAHPYYMENPYYGQQGAAAAAAAQGHPGMRPPPGQGGEWNGQGAPPPNPYGGPPNGGIGMGGGQAGTSGEGGGGGGQEMGAHLQMEMMQCQQHMQRLYAQPRTPHIEQEIGRFEQRIHHLQMQLSNGTQSGTASQGGGGEQTTVAGGGGGGIMNQQQQPMQQFAPPPGQTSTGPPTGAATAAAAGYPPSFPGVPSQGGQREGGGGPPNHMTSPPVSVTGGTNQIQVNIKPEQAGHTLISVYQMPPEGSGYAGHSVPPPQVAPPRESTEEHPKSSDSVPPEPIPSYHNASSMGGMPLDPYGMTRGAPPNETLANSTTTICPKIEPIEAIPSTSQQPQQPCPSEVPQKSCSPSLSESSSSMAPIPNSHPPTDDEATREMIQIKTEPSTSIDDEEEERRRKEEELMDAPPRAPVRIEEMR